MEKFIVKHYSDDQRPTIKGNGFDGLEVGEDREEAEEFVDFINNSDKWILVEDELPEVPENKHAIAVIGYGYFGADYVKDVSHVSYNKNKQFCTLVYGHNGAVFVPVDILKWQSIPDPPKGA